MKKLSTFLRLWLQAFRRIGVDQSAPWGYVKGKPAPYHERATGGWQ